MASGVFMAVCIVGSLIAYLAAIGITTYCNIPSISQLKFSSSVFACNLSYSGYGSIVLQVPSTRLLVN